MTTVADALSRAARTVSVDPPSTWVSATADEHVEIRDDFLLETIEDLHNRVDWASPVGKQTAIAGTGAEDYDLPTDFFRLKKDPYAVYETSNIRRIGTPVTTDGEWTHIKQIGTGAGTRFFRIKGFDENYQISFYPNPASGESVTVSYVSDLWVQDSGGTNSDTFDDELDKLLFPRRIIELGIIWRWRHRKGLPYETYEAQYERRLAVEANRTNVRRTIGFGETRPWSPFDIPVPDFIPS